MTGCALHSTSPVTSRASSHRHCESLWKDAENRRAREGNRSSAKVIVSMWYSLSAEQKKEKKKKARLAIVKAHKHIDMDQKEPFIVPGRQAKLGRPWLRASVEGGSRNKFHVHKTVCRMPDMATSEKRLETERGYSRELVVSNRFLGGHRGDEPRP